VKIVFDRVSTPAYLFVEGKVEKVQAVCQNEKMGESAEVWSVPYGISLGKRSIDLVLKEVNGILCCL
jgi:hypothetical protein